MARIRSIKPSFATDGKIRRLSDTTALFFVLLWNHCDDYGYFELDTWELAMKTARWRSQDIMRMLWALHGAGLVRLSQGHGVGIIRSWEHQRIDKRQSSKWKDVSIQWDDAEQLRERSKNVPRKDRIGEDRKGKERIGVTHAAEIAELIPGKQAPKANTKATWEAYANAYSHRYNSEPVRNARVNSCISQFVKRIGEQEAPQVAAYYVSHNDGLYVKAMHAVTLLLRDAESLRTQWFSGTQMTGMRSRQIELSETNRSVWQTANDELEAIRKGKENG